MRVKDLVRVLSPITKVQFRINKRQCYHIKDDNPIKPEVVKNLKEYYNVEDILKDNILLDKKVLGIYPIHKYVLMINIK